MIIALYGFPFVETHEYFTSTSLTSLVPFRMSVTKKSIPFILLLAIRFSKFSLFIARIWFLFPKLTGFDLFCVMLDFSNEFLNQKIFRDVFHGNEVLKSKFFQRYCCF